MGEINDPNIPIGKALESPGAAEHLGRPEVIPMDEILGRPYRVLDQGFVRVVDYMGDDAAIVQAARVSYGKGTKKLRDDRGLIRYLLRNRHTTPFEMAELKLHVRVPMDAWRQWIRHRTASVNEYSTRYSEAIDANQKTSDGGWRVQAGGNRQGSGEFLSPTIGKQLTDVETNFHKRSREVYQERLEMGVAREQARKDLPLSTYTEAYWKVDLHNLLHFLSLRLNPHAQEEIRAYANVIAQIVEQWVPLTWEAFKDYRLESMQLTGPEVDSIRRMLQSFVAPSGWRWEELTSRMSKREIKEMEAKLQRLGIV